MADTDVGVADRPRAADFVHAQSMLDSGAPTFREIFPAERITPKRPDFMYGLIPHALIDECWGPGFEWAPRNRDTIERLALRAGFSIVYPEQWSLLEQFRLVASASVVLGEYGSALHSTLFAGPGLTVCALRGTGLHPGFIQSAIGSALGQRTGYLFGEHQDHDVPGGFTVSENVLRDYLMSF
jgi:hypothetical protein